MIKNNVSLEKSCGLSIVTNQGPRQKSIVLSGQSKKRVPYGILTSVYSVPKWVFFLLKKFLSQVSLNLSVWRQGNKRRAGGGKTAHWYSWRYKNETPSGKHCYLPFLPATPTFLSETLEGRRVSSKFPGLAWCIACITSEIQVHYQVSHARLGGPKPPSRTTDTNLNCGLVEKALLLVVPKIGRDWPPFTAP